MSRRIPTYWTSSEAARRLGVTRLTVQRWLADGRLHAAAYYTRGGRTSALLLPAEVERLRDETVSVSSG